jgi:hypothetical protein
MTKQKSHPQQEEYKRHFPIEGLSLMQSNAKAKSFRTGVWSNPCVCEQIEARDYAERSTKRDSIRRTRQEKEIESTSNSLQASNDPPSQPSGKPPGELS